MYSRIKIASVSCLCIFSALMLTIASNTLNKYNLLLFLGSGISLLATIILFGILFRIKKY